MKAIILDHPKDIEIFKTKNQNLNFYAYNFYTYLRLRKKYKYVKYVNDQKLLSSYNEFSKNLSINWFNENRRKNINNQKISIGNIILSRLINEFSNILKNYFIIKKILSRNSEVIFPQSQKKYIFVLLELFPNKIKFYNTNNKIHRILSTNQLRGKILPLPVIHKLSNIARLIQYFFFVRKKNKTFYYPDPRTKNFFKNFQNILHLNSIIFWKSFYFKYSHKYLIDANSIVDFNFKKDLKRFLKTKSKKEYIPLLKIFENCINNIVLKNKKNILRSFAIYLELFDYYKPKSVIFPGILNFDYAIATEIAKIKNIKTFIALDGVLTNYDQIEFNNNYIFDKIFAWGNENRILLQNHKIKKKDIILSDTFYYNKLKNINIKKNIILVLPLVHYSQKVFTQPDKCIYHTLDILKVLNKMREKNIILKLKLGNYNISEIVKIYKNFIKESDLKNISIEVDKLENYFQNTKLIIGQCSSSIYEARINNIDYHIYEPYDLGLSRHDINNSNLFNNKSVSRNQSDLLKNLKKINKSSIIKTNRQIFKGQKIKSNFFND